MPPCQNFDVGPNIVSTFGSKFALQHIMDVVMATPIQRCNSDIKLTRNRKERKMWAIHGCMLTYPKPCFKVVKKFNNDITFVWYTGSILLHRSQSNIFLLHSKSS